MVDNEPARTLPPNIVAIAHAPYRNSSRARSGFTATGVPFRCHTAASFLQTSTQAPHFMQFRSVFPSAIDSFESATVGQLVWHSVQSTHFVRSNRISKRLILFEERLKRAEGAEESALCSFFRQIRQHHHQPQEQRNENPHLDRRLHVAHRGKLRHRLERAKPHAVDRLKDRRRNQHHENQNGPRNQPQNV